MAIHNVFVTDRLNRSPTRASCSCGAKWVGPDDDRAFEPWAVTHMQPDHPSSERVLRVVRQAREPGPARAELLARTFVELADTLVDDFDIVEVTQTLVERCVELFDATAAGLLVADPEGNLQVLASSSDQLRVVELFEVQARQGPCLDCYRSGQPVINQDLAHINGRWPYFVPVALVAGYHSVHALPVRLRQQVIGTLNLFRADTGTLNAKDVLVAQAIADATAIAILQQRALQDAHLLADQLQKALHSRIPIEQAKGVLAERAKLSVSDALIHIRSYARNHNQQLTSVCRRVIDGTLSVSDLVERPRA